MEPNETSKIIQELSEEHVPETLKSAIIRGIIVDPVLRVRRQRTLQLIATGCVVLAFGSFTLLSKSATAVMIPKIRTALENKKSFWIGTYQNENGKRTPVSETHISEKGIKFVLIGPTGSKKSLSEEFQKLAKDLRSGQSGESSRSPVKRIGTREQELLEQDLQELSGSMEELAKEFEKLENTPQSEQVLTNCDLSRALTDQLLTKSELWTQLSDKKWNGRSVLHYTLKQNPQNFHLYVDPGTFLPVRTIMDQRFGSRAFSIENVYTYVE